MRRKCPERRSASIDKGLEIRELEPAFSSQARAAPPTAPAFSGGSGGSCPRAQRCGGLALPWSEWMDPPPRAGLQKALRQSAQRRAMESAWSQAHWARRPFDLALMFCLAPGLLQAIKLYLQRHRAASRPAPLPLAPHPLVLRASQGR